MEDFEKYNLDRHGLTIEGREKRRRLATSLLVIGTIPLIIGAIVLLIVFGDFNWPGFATGMAFVVVGALALFFWFRRWSEIRNFDNLVNELQNNGRVTRGLIVRATSSSVQSGGIFGGRRTARSIRVVYTFRDKGGIEHQRVGYVDTGGVRTRGVGMGRAFVPRTVSGAKDAVAEVQDAKGGLDDWRQARQMQGKSVVVAFNENGSVILDVEEMVDAVAPDTDVLE